jgi:uncharacterized damage-inducible protein DinB
MTNKGLEMLFQHNNWANQKIIDACSSLTDEQLDAEPASATRGSIRTTLLHLVTSQLGYLRLLTLPLEQRMDRIPIPPFAELKQHAANSGEALLEWVRGETGTITQPIRSRDNYLVEPWVILVQVINHATEHREQIKSMLTALGVPPPEIDGWSYGDFAGGIVPMEEKTGG